MILNMVYPDPLRYFLMAATHNQLFTLEYGLRGYYLDCQSIGPPIILFCLQLYFQYSRKPKIPYVGHKIDVERRNSLFYLVIDTRNLLPIRDTQVDETKFGPLPHAKTTATNSRQGSGTCGSLLPPRNSLRR